uniref:non-specific serine/threonine protein kinase n=1 Tax=Salarias fasciatus TaxID=181472 RepID=A0A672JSN9_SALFA
MEVQNTVYSTGANSDSKNKTKEHQTPSTQEKRFSRRSLKDERTCAETNMSSKKEQRPSTSVAPAAFTSTRHAASGAESKQAPIPEKKAGRKEVKETQSPHPGITSTLPQSSASSPVVSTLKQDIYATDHVTVMDVDVQLKASSDGSAAHTDSPSVDKSQDSRTALPQRSSTPSARQTSSHQKKASVSRPAPPSEVTQAHAKMSRNDAPVSLEIPPDQHAIASKELQKTPTEKQTKRRDIHTSSLHSSLQDTIDEIKVNTSDKSRESNESHTARFTQLPKPPLQSPSGGGAVNTQECNVLPTVLESQVDTAIKSDKGPKIHDSKKAEANGRDELFVPAGSTPANKKIVEMETEPVKVLAVEHTRTKRTKDAGDGESGVVSVNERRKKESGKNDAMSQVDVVEKVNPKSETPKSDTFETPPLQPKPPRSTNSLDRVKDFQEVQKPATKIISVAEMLRSQIKALEISLLNSVSVIPASSDLVQEPSATATEPSPDLRDAERKDTSELKKSRSDRKSETSIDNTPLTTIKATLMEVYNQLLKDDQEQNEMSACVQALQEPVVVPPISVVDTGLTAGIAESYKHADTMDIGQETEAPLILPQDSPVKQSSPLPILNEDKLNNTFQAISNQPERVSHTYASPITVTQADIPETNVTVLGHTEEQLIQGKDIELEQNVTEGNELNSKSEKMVTEINVASHYDHNKMEECCVVSGFVQTALKSPSESDSNSGKQEINNFVQLDSSVVNEQVKSDSFTNPTPEPSPLLKRRSCVSPLPSATPQELASGARRKILTPKAKPEEVTEATYQGDSQTQKKEASQQSSKLSTSPLTPSVSPSLSRRSPLLQPDAGEQTPPAERRSPLVSRRKTAPEPQTPSLLQPDESQTEQKPAEKDKHNPFKAPQVIRKIRGENFADSSGHLKLWCQFFNVLSDSTITWYKNEEEISQMKRNAGDETQVNLAIVQASCKDSGVYGCSITNEYGTDSTDILLSTDSMYYFEIKDFFLNTILEYMVFFIRT